jgi:hypothetical protein
LKSILACLLLAAALLASACAPDTGARAAAAPTSTPADLPSDDGGTPVSPAVDECLKCHTDQERLIETAKPEEVVVKESSGTG